MGHLHVNACDHRMIESIYTYCGIVVLIYHVILSDIPIDSDNNTFISMITNSNHEMGHLHVNACDHRMIEILSSMMYITYCGIVVLIHHVIRII